MLNMRLWRPEALVDINDLDDARQIEVDGASTTSRGAGALHHDRAVPAGGRAAPLARGDRDPHRRPSGPQPRDPRRGAGARRPDGRGPPRLHGARRQLVCGRDTPRVECLFGTSYEGSYATVLDRHRSGDRCRVRRSPHSVCVRRRSVASITTSQWSASLLRANPQSTGPGRCSLGVGGVADTALRVDIAERCSRAEAHRRDIAAAAGQFEVIDPPSDIRASADYRRHLVPIQVARSSRLRDGATPRKQARREIA